MTSRTGHPAANRPTLDKNNPREIFGWKMYDWANSAFYTTVVGALFSPYITRLAQDAVGKNGTVLDLGFLGTVTAESFPTLCVSISVGLQVLVLPILGALGDYSNLEEEIDGASFATRPSSQMRCCSSSAEIFICWAGCYSLLPMSALAQRWFSTTLSFRRSRLRIKATKCRVEASLTVTLAAVCCWP